MALTIDLNCDLGEGFGVYQLGQDKEMLTLVSSCNIACGFHAGDPTTIRHTIELALENMVAIGAHPGYPDLVGFGRRAMQVSPQEVEDMVMYQVAALKGMVEAYGGTLHHVKPHGALYNTAAKESDIAHAIARAVARTAPNAILYGLTDSTLINAAEAIGLAVAHEVFADRTYQADGSLTPRTAPQAILHNETEAVEQVLMMIEQQKVQTVNGQLVSIKADTLCLHGDHPNAVSFARALRQVLAEKGVQISAP